MRIVPANRSTTAVYTEPLFCSVRVQANTRTEISTCFDCTFLTSKVSSVDRKVGLSCTCIPYVTFWEHMSCQNSEGVFSVVLSKHNELDTLIITLCSSKMGRKTSECLGSVQSGLKAVRPTHMIAHLPTCSCTAVHALAMVTCVCSTLKKATRDMDQQMMQCRTWPLLASFPGSARDAYNISSCENGAFLLVETTVCCRFYY